MNTQPPSTKRGRGRPHAFTEELALATIRNRRMFTEPITAQRFRDEMIAAGELPSRVGVGSIRRLLKGVTFPDLYDPEHLERVNYTELPKFGRGRIRLDVTPDLQAEREHRMPKLRQQMMDAVRKYARIQMEAMFLAARQQIIREPIERAVVVERQLDALCSRVAALEAK